MQVSRIPSSLHLIALHHHICRCCSYSVMISHAGSVQRPTHQPVCRCSTMACCSWTVPPLRARSQQTGRWCPSRPPPASCSPAKTKVRFLLDSCLHGRLHTVPSSAQSNDTGSMYCSHATESGQQHCMLCWGPCCLYPGRSPDLWLLETSRELQSRAQHCSFAGGMAPPLPPVQTVETALGVPAGSLQVSSPCLQCSLAELHQV